MNGFNVIILLVFFSSCASGQYHHAVKQNDRPYGECTQVQPNNSTRPIHLYLLTKQHNNKTEEWVEGHGSFIFGKNKIQDGLMKLPDMSILEIKFEFY